MEPSPEHVWVAWSETRRPDPVIELRGAADHDAKIDLDFKLMLGSRTFEWTEGPIDVPAATTLPYVLTLPAEAWLDPLCATYVSRLTTLISGARPGGLSTVYVGWRRPSAKPA